MKDQVPRRWRGEHVTKKILGVKTLCSGVNILAEHTYGQEQI